MHTYSLLLIYKMTTEKKLFFGFHQCSEPTREIQGLHLMYDLRCSRIFTIFSFCLLYSYFILWMIWDFRYTSVKGEKKQCLCSFLPLTPRKCWHRFLKACEEISQGSLLTHFSCATKENYLCFGTGGEKK